MSQFVNRVRTQVAAAFGAGAPAHVDVPIATVHDIKGNAHHLVEELGRGGQGTVYRTANPEIAVKLLTDAAGKPIDSGDGARAAALTSTIERVLTLPLPAIGLAVPLVPLRGAVGYAMRLLGGMQPLGRMMGLKGDPGKFYSDTGGLRRRLALLATLADRMASLHGVGLVFVDLSPNNVFVSSDVGYSEVWLIDLDNMHYLEQRVLRTYTPRYGAPEVVSGRSGANTLSDCWSFAVIAHELLRMVHPFEGAAVESSGWSVTVSGVEKKPDEQLPWIDDPEDKSNRSPHGRALEATCTKKMVDLFTRTFCGGGRNPTKRPSMNEWAEALWEAHDLAVVCKKCRASTFIGTNRAHDCCGATRAPVIRIESRIWVPELDDGILDLAQGRGLAKELAREHEAISPDRTSERRQQAGEAQRPAVATMRVAVGEDTEVPLSLIQATNCFNRRRPVIALRFLGNRLVIEPVGDSRTWQWVEGEGSRILPAVKKFDAQIPSASGYLGHLHCGPEDKAHRLVSFVLLDGAQNAG